MQSSIEDFFGCCRNENEISLSIEGMDKAIMKAVIENNIVEANKE